MREGVRVVGWSGGEKGGVVGGREGGGGGGVYMIETEGGRGCVEVRGEKGGGFCSCGRWRGRGFLCMRGRRVGGDCACQGEGEGASVHARESGVWGQSVDRSGRRIVRACTSDPAGPF